MIHLKTKDIYNYKDNNLIQSLQNYKKIIKIYYIL